MSAEPRRTPEQILLALKAWLGETRMSQRELADRLGLPQPTLSRYLRGKRKIPAELIEKLEPRIPRGLLNLDRVAPESTEPKAPAGAPRVFLSSTYLDNVKRRARVIEAIERAGCYPIAMERWSADDRRTQLKCLGEVEEADVFVGILAWKYGWIPDGKERSITELEYDAAAGKPRFMFVIDQPLEDVNVAEQFDAGRDRWALQQRLDAFKERVTNDDSTWYPFGDDEAALASAVMQSLFEWRLRREGARGEVPTLPERPDREDELVEYYEHVEHEHGHITLAGFETRLRLPLRFDDLYVPLDVAPHDHDERLRGEKGDELAHTEPDTITLAETLAGLFRNRGRLAAVLLGDPGSGKTTQLRRTALRIAQQGPGSLGMPDDVIPVFLPLRRLEAGDDSLARFFKRLLGDDDLDFGKAFVDWLWKQRLLLLVDGLDEVPQARRGEVRGWIERCAEGRRRHRALVSCRFEGYRGDARFDGPRFVALELRPLSNERREELVRNWYRAVETAVVRDRNGGAAEERRASRQAAADATDLIQRLRTKRATRLYEFAANPLLLTSICLVHRDRGSTLPERRAVLYDECVKGLLELWREQKRLEGGATFEAAQARRVLQPLALWMHGSEGRTRATAEVLAPILEPALRRAKFSDDVTAEKFLAKIRDESGILTGWSGDDYGFLHLGFQEYLAAQELRERIFAQADDPERYQAEIASLLELFGGSWWHEVFCMLFADEGPSLFKPVFRSLVRSDKFVDRTTRVGEVVRDALHFSAEPFLDLLGLDPGEGLWDQRVMALEILMTYGPNGFEEEVDPEPYRRVVRSRRASREAQEGARAVLSGLGIREERSPVGTGVAFDPTLVATLRSTRGEYELRYIPGGRFLMGSPEDERGRYSDEGHQHEVEVPAFHLGVHPVTNEEYGRYLEQATGAVEPKFWGDRRYNQPKQPVVGVSWSEAVAYCDWAGLVLPSEAQWEYACRAGTTSRYWSGNSGADLARVGWYGDNSGGHPHAVGEKPANPFGLFDVHGNVWEWCLDHFGSYREAARAHPDAYESASARNRVIRGGSLRDSAGGARSAYRSNARPVYRGVSLGFRPARVIEP